jgi:serine/threonine protein kinase
MSIAFEENELRTLVGERIDQWRAGAEPDAAAFLDKHPELEGAKSLVLELVLEEYCLRRAAGDTVVKSTFCERFGTYRQSIVKMLEVQEYLDQCPAFAAETERADWPLVGERFMGYEIVEPLGRGALARVYLAREPALGNRLVVIKVSRFGAREAETLGKLSHPNIVPIHSVQHDDVTGWTVICMPLLGAATGVDLLDAVLAGGAAPLDGSLVARVAGGARLTANVPRPAAEAELEQWRGPLAGAIARMGWQLAEGLEEAHVHGVMHRDIKPSNVLLAWSGRPMLLDFNLSTDAQTTSQRIGGTLAYMAPERIVSLMLDGGASAQELDPRCDIYSLGVVLYELLAGRLPARPENAESLPLDAYPQWLASKRQSPPPLRTIRGQTDPRLEAIVLKCLAFEAGERYATAAELAADLRAYLGPAEASSGPATGNGRGWLYAALGVAICGVGLAVGAIALTGISRRDQVQPILAQPTQERPSPEGRLQAGLALYDRGEYQQAIEVFDRCLELKSGWPEAHFARGQAFRRLGEWVKARTDFMSLVGVNRGWAYALAGYCDVELKDDIAAVDDLRRARLIGVRDTTVLLNFGYSLLVRSSYLEAIDVYNEVLSREPQNSLALRNRAQAYFSKAAPSNKVPNAQAFQDAREDCRLNPDSFEAAYSAGLIFAYAATIDSQYADEGAHSLTRALELGLPRDRIEQQRVPFRALLPKVDPALIEAAPPQDPSYHFRTYRYLAPPQTADWHAFLAEVGASAK